MKIDSNHFMKVILSFYVKLLKLEKNKQKA